MVSSKIVTLRFDSQLDTDHYTGSHSFMQVRSQAQETKPNIRLHVGELVEVQTLCEQMVLHSCDTPILQPDNHQQLTLQHW